MVCPTGEVAVGAVHADLTVTFDSRKPLHAAESSAPLCGKIICADIGIRDEWHRTFERPAAETHHLYRFDLLLCANRAITEADKFSGDECK